MNFVILPGQLHLTLLLLYAGMAGGIWYDISRLPAHFPGPVWLWDMVFSLALWALYAMVMGMMGETQVRPVTVALFGGGFWLYRAGIHRAAVWCFQKISGRKKAADGEQ